MLARFMPDWAAMFVPDQPIVESFLRGVIIYLALIVLFRAVLRRQSGSVGLPDIMLVVLVSECVSNAIGSEAKSIPNGLAAVCALLVTNFALDLLAYRWKWLQARLESEPLPLIRNGVLLQDHLAQERLSEDDLLAQLRLNGIDDPSKVQLACMESEGKISVVPRPSTGDQLHISQDQADSDLDRNLAEFLLAAAALERAVRTYEESAANHLQTAREIRQKLAEKGVRIPSDQRGRKERKSTRNRATPEEKES